MREVTPIDNTLKNYRAAAVSENAWSVIGPTVLDWVAQVPHSSGRASGRSLSATAQFVRWCWQSQGFGLKADDLLQVGVIDEFVWNGLKDVSDSTRATYRADLIRVARSVRPGDEALRGTRRFEAQERVNPPYTRQQELLLNSWAAAQATRYGVVNAKVLLACGLGAGLTTNEVMRLQAGHVEVDDDGVLLHVTGSNPRVVPVRQDWEDVLATVAQAAWKPEMYLFRPNRQTITANSVYNFLCRSQAVPFPISMQRMRTTWIINHLAAGVSIPAVRQAAGIRQRSGLRRYLDFLVEPHPDDARRSLRLGRPVGGEDR